MIARYIDLIDRVLSRFPVVAELMTRAVIGYVFIMSGWGKLTHLDHVIEFFTSLHIPYPHLQAPLVAATELLCGLMVAGGILIRLASIPLIVIMVVALKTAKGDDIGGIDSLFETYEFLYIVLLVWLATYGAGVFSLDRFLFNHPKRKSA